MIKAGFLKRNSRKPETKAIAARKKQVVTMAL